MAFRGKKDNYIPLSTRFQAWWDGVDARELAEYKRLRSAAPDPLAIEVDEEPDEDDGKRWPERRVAFCRRLFDIAEEDETVQPGGADYTLWLVKPMSLNSEQNAADLSAGLGGGTRKVSKELGLYIDGYESDPELAELAMELSRRHGMDKKVAVTPFDPDDFTLPAGRYNGILTRERAYRIRNKAKYLETICNALRPRGHIILTDFVLASPNDELSPIVEAWKDREAAEFTLWTADDYRKTLTAQRMDVRIIKDETEEFRQILLKAWTKLATSLDKGELTREFVNTMMHEAEYWLILIKAMEMGKIKYYRFHGIRGGETM
ncbi:class I SAM-dependent methyltransferase [Rhodospirillaceae bacterium KN72]|uniref:Class I SAM-dependent methyltransferase n=1 Tax=Pacificispira spongiicola TaxID=2729598 RepID=A0A7Y0DZF6_9PROT|nr:methyltransferase domain-containing protein [Pacificispira spongiicola]NMM44432.1 class I SAM-dependent methyltransferase [Pacificispira spongiicola]